MATPRPLPPMETHATPAFQVETNRFRKLSIIIPCYNEHQNIEKVLEVVQGVDVGMEKELIIIDDGSTDGTVEVLQEIREKTPDADILKVHFSMLNSGKGFAIRIGLKYATGDIVLIQDADLEYDPHDIPKVLAPIKEGKADVVYGSRFKGSVQGMALPNLVCNKILAGLATLLYGTHITDEATAYKAFRRDVIQKVDLKCQRFEFCPEVTAKVLKAGAKLVEVPITYRGRTTAEGKKIGWKDGVEAIYTLLLYRFKK
ncbi:MAG TPA: glycosyltransferase family 2 protein [bacterium]|nr:glycosyltransferase family 2 protein [bacterium]